MAASTSTSANLSMTIAHAISFLTRPLVASYPANAVLKLQLVLEANLTALYAASWVLKEPFRGSGRRCLTLSPDCIPPRSIYSACVAADVQWFDWINLLGGREFDLFVDPGRVSIRYGRKNASDNQFITIWAADTASPATLSGPFVDAQRTPQQQKAAHNGLYTKTVAQQLLEGDHEDDDQLFAMIAHEISAPTWMTPLREQFPAPVRSLSSLSTHSRSSSRSSNSSSSFSSNGSITSMSTSSLAPVPDLKPSRRERARQARVFVDTSKTEVTPYDGGKTTVLTGGVMLGSSPNVSKPKKVARPTPLAAANWRSARA